MPRFSNTPKAETFTFRLDPALKDALTRSAAEEHIQPAELMRKIDADFDRDDFSEQWKA